MKLAQANLRWQGRTRRSAHAGPPCQRRRMRSDAPCRRLLSAVKRFASFALLSATALPLIASPDGNAQIHAKTQNSALIISTTRRLAGAIDSLKWNGHEFINSTDHGRQLQSACSFDNTPQAGAETFNPTEAGSRDDGAGTNTTSRLLEISATKNHLRTRTQMAFWLAPGERSEGQLARNTNTLSDDILTKDVTIGFQRWPQALDYRVTFSLPPSARHVSAQFEALTGYLPETFSRFWQFNSVTGKLEPLSDGPGEIKNSVVLATPDGQFAMGIFALPPGQPDTRGPTFGRWKFDWARVVKWNCVYRVENSSGIRDSDYSYRMLVPIGTLAQVEAMLRDWRDLGW